MRADDGGGNGGNGAGDGGSARFASVEDFFAAEVQPGLDFCRSCHVPEGVSGSDPDAARFTLSRDPEEDYQRLQAAWQALGEGVTDNLLLIEPVDPAEPHSMASPGRGAARSTPRCARCWPAGLLGRQGQL